MKMKKVLVKQTSRITKHVFLALLLLSSAIMVYGQGYEEWSKDIGGQDTEYFKAIQQTSDGGFIA